MPNTPDVASCFGPPNGKRAFLPANPFLGLFYHFGQLLGVDDFETEQAYLRGKTRLHNAWLHRAGVVWGLDVAYDAEHGEVRVKPGLALDGAGRELHLDADACLKLADWYLANKADAAMGAAGAGEQIVAHVLIRFKACLSRPVPAMAEPCVGAQTDTAYSRAVETVELLLRPGPAPWTAPPYHRLRLLFALDDPRADGSIPVSKDDEAVLKERDTILALPLAQQPKAYLAAFRKLAALDEMGLAPFEAEGARLLFPAPDDAGVVLAAVTITLKQGDAGALTPDTATVDNTIRPSHVATSTIQELLCGPLFRGGLAPGEAPSAATGPRIDPDTFEIDSEKLTVTFTTTAPLVVSSVTVPMFSLATFDQATGWTAIAFDSVDTAASGGGTEVTLHLHEALPENADLIRFVAIGTGPQPILGVDFTPLAGSTDDPPDIPTVGRDFVHHKIVEHIPS